MGLVLVLVLHRIDAGLERLNGKVRLHRTTAPRLWKHLIGHAGIDSAADRAVGNAQALSSKAGNFSNLGARTDIAKHGGDLTAVVGNEAYVTGPNALAPHHLRRQDEIRNLVGVESLSVSGVQTRGVLLVRVVVARTTAIDVNCGSGLEGKGSVRQPPCVLQCFKVAQIDLLTSALTIGLLLLRLPLRLLLSLIGRLRLLLSLRSRRRLLPRLLSCRPCLRSQLPRSLLS